MIWADRIAQKLKEKGRKSEWVDDMKTPSGRAHAGSLRTIVTHDVMYRALLDHGIDTTFSYVFDSQDPMDGLPVYLDKSQWEKYMGMQLYKIPSPEEGYESFGHYYAHEFQKAFEVLGCHPQIIWGHELYLSGKMNESIKLVLDSAEKIREIYEKVSKNPRPTDWHAFNVVCEKCQKIGTTYTYKWDGEHVHYRCRPDQVKWASGCGYEGKVTPYDGQGKIPWKVEWACKWKVIGVTVEGAGKDHMSAGGSHDIASLIARQVLEYEVPHPFAHEYFIVGGRKMSSSKGVGISANEAVEIVPPEVMRFLIARTPIQRVLDFDPRGDTIPDLFDEYDRCMEAYFLVKENKAPKGKKGDLTNDLARIMELSQIRPLPDARAFLPRFRTIVHLVRTNGDIYTHFSSLKGRDLTPQEKEILEERVVYAQQYLKKYADDVRNGLKPFPTEADKKTFELSDVQKMFLTEVSASLKGVSANREEIQNVVFATLKKTDVKPRQAFEAFYQVLTGKSAGPRAADLILEIGVEKVREIIGKAIV